MMSNAEKQKRYRAKKRNAPVTEKVTRVTTEQRNVTSSALRYACRLDYHVNRQDYIPRREPNSLNWGPWMDSSQLEQAELEGNRVAIPGDWDYAGVALEAVA